MREEDSRRIIEAFFARNGFVAHQLRSYDHFMEEIVPYTVREYSTLKHTSASTGRTLRVELGKVTITRPATPDGELIMPDTARRTGRTYEACVLAPIRWEDVSEGGERVTGEDVVEVARIPVMVRSALCNLRMAYGAPHEAASDDGGYFIVKGVEKAIVCQEHLRTNMPIVTREEGSVTVEVRCLAEGALRSTSTLRLRLEDGRGEGNGVRCSVEIPFMQRQTLSLATLLHHFGVQGKEGVAALVAREVAGMGASDRAHLLLQDALEDDPLADASLEVLRDALGRLCSEARDRERRIRDATHLVNAEVLPQYGTAAEEAVHAAKAEHMAFLAVFAARVLVGEADPNDRDHYALKRLDGPGILLGTLLRHTMRLFVASGERALARTLAQNRPFDLAGMRRLLRVTPRIRFALATGRWGVKRGETQAPTGVAQAFKRATRLDALSHLRRISNPAPRDAGVEDARRGHPSAWGVVDAVETPEGKPCGLVKALALLAEVRLPTPSRLVRELLPSAGMGGGPEGVRVLLNGRVEGRVADAEAFLATMRAHRRAGAFPRTVGIFYCDDLSACCVNTDGGAFVRPVVALDRLDTMRAILASPALALEEVWDALCDAGAVVYLDKDEEFASGRVAVSLQQVEEEGASAAVALPPGARLPPCAVPGPGSTFTLPFAFVEIHGVVTLGACSALIPFSDRNQAPRNTYQAAMCKQAISARVPADANRFDTLVYSLDSPQVPLVQTWLERLVGLDQRPTGRNCTVAVLCYTGYNMEDSLIFNEAFLQRGAFDTHARRTYRESESEVGTERSRICAPTLDTLHDAREASYAKLDAATGVAQPGTAVRAGDAIIGKTIRTVELNPDERTGSRASRTLLVERDRSTVLRAAAPGAVVDRISTAIGDYGHKHVQVSIRHPHRPSVGDKFSSRHGQKGVIGLVLPAQDMPFDPATGAVPDIIMNPHAFPSRMTIGHLVESLAALGCALDLGSAFADGTPFRERPVTVEALAEVIAASDPGRDGFGRRRLVSGITGEPIGPVFLGTTFYQPLKHLSSDKEHARARGSIDALTGQPVEGRQRDGGLRFGEMERDTGVMHGAAHFLRDRLLEQSDGVDVPVCGRCGLLASNGANPAVPPTERTLLSTKPYCLSCRSDAHVAVVLMPAAMRLYLQEMMALGIAPRLVLEGVELRSFPERARGVDDPMAAPDAEERVRQAVEGVRQRAEQAARACRA
jgi:DNA-directed RNA polymerase II subunit RPB2